MRSPKIVEIFKLCQCRATNRGLGCLPNTLSRFESGAAAETTTAEDAVSPTSPASPPASFPSNDPDKKPGKRWGQRGGKRRREAKMKAEAKKASSVGKVVEGDGTMSLGPKGTRKNSEDGVASGGFYKQGDFWLHKGNWKNLQWILKSHGENWSLAHCKIAWKRSVNAHLQPAIHALLPSAACHSPEGRKFLLNLRNRTVDLAQTEKMVPTEARDIGWAAGKQYWLDKELSQVVVDGLLENGDLRQPPVPLAEVVPVIWGMANSGQYPRELLDMLITKKTEILDSFNVQNCTNVLWAMAISGYHPGILFLRWMSEYAAGLFVKSPNSVLPQAVGDLMWSLGRFGFEPEPVKVVHKVLGWAYDRLPAFEVSEITSTAMGLAMCKVLTVEDMRKLGTSFRERALKTSLPLESIHYDRMYMMTLLFPPVQRLPLQEQCFGSNLEKIAALRQERQSQIAVQMRGNRFLQRVGRHLERQGVSYEIGVLSADRSLAVELLVTEKDDTYAVIPVFPSSRNRNDSSLLLGETILAKMLIEGQGMKYGGTLEWSSGKTPKSEEKSEGSDDVVEAENVAEGAESPQL